MLRMTLLVLLLVFLAGDATGQTAFRVRLSGDQPVPASAAVDTGDGYLVLDPASGRIRYSVTLTGLSAAVTGAALHRGAPGQTGTAIFSLAGGPLSFEGESAALSASDIELLADGATYLQVTVAAQPAGELRGQVCAAWNEYLVDADGPSALPPSGSAGIATGILNLTEAGFLQYGLTTSGLTSPLQGASLRRGSPGAEAGVIVRLPTQTFGGKPVLQGVVGPLPEVDRAWIRSGRAWLTIETQNFPDTAAQPGGELRGVLRPWQYQYGQATGPSTASTPVVLNLLPWKPGGLVDIYLLNDSFGLVPYQLGWMMVSPIADVASLPGNGQLLVDLATSFAVPLPAGAHNVQAFLPATLPPPSWLHIQFIGADASGNVLASRGVAVVLNP